MKQLQETYEAGGFVFRTKKEAELAQREIEGTKYLRQKLDMENPNAVFSIYQNLIEQDLFETPVGYCFLKELRDYLLMIPAISNEEVLAIPIRYPQTEEEEKKQKKEQKKEELPVQGTYTKDKKLTSVEVPGMEEQERTRVMSLEVSFRISRRIPSARAASFSVLPLTVQGIVRARLVPAAPVLIWQSVPKTSRTAQERDFSFWAYRRRSFLVWETRCPSRIN